MIIIINLKLLNHVNNIHDLEYIQFTQNQYQKAIIPENRKEHERAEPTQSKKKLQGTVMDTRKPHQTGRVEQDVDPGGQEKSS